MKLHTRLLLTSFVMVALCAIIIGWKHLFPAGQAAARSTQTQEISRSALLQISALMQEKESRTPAQQKIDSHLLFALKAKRNDPLIKTVPSAAQNKALEDANGKTLVDIRADVSKALQVKIVQLGGEVISAFEQYHAIRARLPLDSLEALAAEAAVKFIAPADEGWTNREIRATEPAAKETTANPPSPRELLNARAERRARIRAQLAQALAANLKHRLPTSRAGLKGLRHPLTGPVNSEGDEAHRADQVRALGINGTGIVIGVMSDGVDALATEQGLGELPAGVTVVPGQAGSGDEGTAMLEIVYDLAPGATLVFATAGGGEANLAANITTLAGAPYNCDIIVDDFTYRNEGVFQDSPASQAVNTISAAGVLFFSSAGNSGNLNDGTSGVWEGDFVDGGTLALVPGGNVHDFGGGVVTNRLTGAAAAGRRVALKWSDPLGASNNDYDLYILDNAQTMVLDSSTNTQNGAQDPLENSNINEAVGHRVVILRKMGAATRALHLNTNRGQLTIGTTGQVFGHNAAGAANAFSVSAVNVGTAGGGVFTGGAANPVATYTSDGLRRIFYTPAGAAITAGNILFSTNGGQVLNKPDITAADCGSTGAPGFATFCGTSAAAPHAAAIAALILSFNPALTPAQVRNALQNSALDIEAAGYDRDAGFGIVMALQAISAVSSANLAITKTDAPDPVIAGANLTYTITAQNNGTGPAVFVQVNDTVSAATPLVSFTSPVGWTCTTPSVGGSGAITCNKDTMAVNESAIFTLVVQVPSCTTHNTILNNTATISSTTTDPDGMNNTATASTTVNRQADLALVVHNDTPDPVIAGNLLTYSITAINNGPSCALNMRIEDNLPANVRFVSASASAGSSLTTPAVGSTGLVRATWAGETTPGTQRALTIIVRVCPEVACNTIINNTATTASDSPDLIANNNSLTANTTVQAQSDLALGVTAVPNPVIAGQNVTLTYTVTNGGPSNSINTVLSGGLPKGFAVISAVTTLGTVTTTALDPVTLQSSVTANLGTLGAANQCMTSFPTSAVVTIVANVPKKYPTTTVSGTATVTTGNCLPDPNPVNNSATTNVTVVPQSSDPGLPYLAASSVSDTKAGSVLVYNLMASNATSPNLENTRFSITNLSGAEKAVVHLFFVDGNNCSVADSFLCLTPNQTASFLASDLDPGTTGYLVAVATDAMTGLPAAFNCLIGDQFVKLSSGHAANLAAEAFAAMMYAPAGLDASATTATLRFDGMSYNAAPRVLALDNFASPADGNAMHLVVNRFGGSLISGAGTLSSLFGLIYDDAEKGVSFSIAAPRCQFRDTLSGTFPRTTPRVPQLVSTGRTGWLKLWADNDFGVLGSAINFNANAAANSGAFNQGHNLHKLTFTNSATLVVPVIIPTC